MPKEERRKKNAEAALRRRQAHPSTWELRGEIAAIYIVDEDGDSQQDQNRR
jgi:hypothetical protein